MSPTEIHLHGTLKPDGTLELDQKPNLPPGRVAVVLRQESQPAAPPKEDWWQFMQRTRRELEAAGSHFMDEKEAQAYIEWLREPDPIDEMLRQADEENSSKEHP